MENEELRQQFIKELNNFPSIKKDKLEVVLAHLLGHNRLNNFDDVFEGDLLDFKGHRLAISNIFYKVHATHNRKKKIEQFRKAGVKKFSFLNPNTGDECEWCLSVQDCEFYCSEDFEKILNENCRCSPYCKGSLIPKISFDES